MSVIKRKIDTFNKIFISNKITKPIVMGKNILLLLSAPDAQNYFEYESVRKQFEGYDLAVVNYMPVYSMDELKKYRPKYFIALDPGFYRDDYFGEGTINAEKEKLTSALNKIDWDCFFITSVVANFRIENEHIKYIRLNCFTMKYNKLTHILYRNNWGSTGFCNVVQGALYYAITFGYKNIAIMGCPYRSLKYHMQPDGLHIHEHNHYYDLSRKEIVISNEELQAYKYGYEVQYHKRALESSMILYYLSLFAKNMKCDITNYSEGSMISVIKAGILQKE